jgi:hypothetical protein
MIRFLSFLSVMFLSACGRGEITSTKQQPLTTTTTSSLVGTYELGPDTAQGFAGLLGRFGHLRIHADNTFDVGFAPGGCIMYFGTGSWTPFFGSAQLDVENGGWLLAPNANTEAQTLIITPSEDGVVATVNGVTQNWVLTTAGE